MNVPFSLPISAGKIERLLQALGDKIAVNVEWSDKKQQLVKKG
jgi:hypothetical protein